MAQHHEDYHPLGTVVELELIDDGGVYMLLLFKKYGFNTCGNNSMHLGMTTK